ncbi:MAG: hypothetical protein P4L16_05660 [Chlamydiales bacterium]|nr:hypothetical protein [Chlamydiales bacterium]
MKITTWIALILALFSFTCKGFTQGIMTNANPSFFQEDGGVGRPHPVRPPPRENGRYGAALASRAGFHTGITTAAIVAGVVVATIVTVAALLLSTGGTQHSH